MAKRTRDLSKEQFWRQMVSQWREGGDTVRSFCRARRLSEASFYAWRRVLVGRDNPQQRRRSAPAFVPVRIVDEASASLQPARHAESRLEVVIVSGQVLRVSRDFDAATLIRLIAVLEGRAAC
jgi:transposase